MMRNHPRLDTRARWLSWGSELPKDIQPASREEEFILLVPGCSGGTGLVSPDRASWRKRMANPVERPAHPLGNVVA
jgi:hypothetical protein